jgi:hypothetical protein
MRHSAKLAILLAFGTAVAVVGCSSDDTTDSPPTSGTGGRDAGAGGTVATGGSTTGGGGSATGGKDAGAGGMAATGGSTTGGGGSATGGGGSATGGAEAGTGGVDAGTGGADAGGADADAGTGTGGADAGASDVDAGAACNETVPAGIGALAAVVLVDDVQIENASSAIVTSWSFADNTSIVDQSVYPPAVGKWTRSPYPPLNQSADAHDVFLACDGSAANGSLEATAPFTAKNQYFELLTTVTQADYSGYTLRAKVKLADGATCAAAYLYTVNAVSPYYKAQGTNTALTTGTWVTVSVTVASDGQSTAVDSFVLNVNTYNCP